MPRCARLCARQSSAVPQAVPQEEDLRFLSTGFSVLEGGIPIVREGKIIGSIGVSGVTSQQDAQTAQAGQDALK